jgi:hypothetical protein
MALVCAVLPSVLIAKDCAETVVAQNDKNIKVMK